MPELVAVTKSTPAELATLAENLEALAGKIRAGEVLAVAWTHFDGMSWESNYVKARGVDSFAVLGAAFQLAADLSKEY